jgi:hypothetical protein
MYEVSSHICSKRVYSVLFPVIPVISVMKFEIMKFYIFGKCNMYLKTPPKIKLLSYISLAPLFDYLNF